MLPSADLTSLSSVCVKRATPFPLILGLALLYAGHLFFVLMRSSLVASERRAGCHHHCRRPAQQQGGRARSSATAAHSTTQYLPTSTTMTVGEAVSSHHTARESITESWSIKPYENCIHYQHILDICADVCKSLALQSGLLV